MKIRKRKEFKKLKQNMNIFKTQEHNEENLIFKKNQSSKDLKKSKIMKTKKIIEN